MRVCRFPPRAWNIPWKLGRASETVECVTNTLKTRIYLYLISGVSPDLVVKIVVPT